MTQGPEHSVRDRLRAATAEAHATLDARMQPLLGGDERDYAAFLTASAHALLPIERALSEAGVARLLADWPARARSEALAADLDALGAPFAGAPPALPIPDEAFLWGALYVLEGSRLGAQALSRLALAHPSGRVRDATRYLRHGAGQGLWRSFLAQLEAAEAPRGALQSAVAGAHWAFAQFERGLDETLAAPRARLSAEEA